MLFLSDEDIMTGVYLNPARPPQIQVGRHEDPREAYSSIFRKHFNTTAIYRAISLIDPELTCLSSADSSSSSPDYLMTWACNAIDNQVCICVKTLQLIRCTCLLVIAHSACRHENCFPCLVEFIVI